MRTWHESGRAFLSTNISAFIESAIVRQEQRDLQRRMNSLHRKKRRWKARLAGMGTVLEILPASSTFSAVKAIRRSQMRVRSALARVRGENLAAINAGIESNLAIEAAKKYAAANRTLLRECAAKSEQLRASLASTDKSLPLPSELEAVARTIGALLRSGDAETPAHAERCTAQPAELRAVIKQATARIEQHLAEIERMRQRLRGSVRNRIQRNDSSAAEHV